MDFKVGDKVIIVKAEGQTIGRDKIPLRDPHPEHIGKGGVITAVDSEDGMPHIRLDNGTELLGCECWWQLNTCCTTVKHPTLPSSLFSCLHNTDIQNK